MSGLNSAKTCLQAPHGNVGIFPEEESAIDTKSLCPSETALNSAFLSAHILRPYEEFSTLHPVKIFPFFVFMADPTLNLEYGL